MTDMSNIESLLEHLRAIRSKQTDHDERFDRLESRLSSLELTVAGMRRDLAHMYGDIVEQHVRNDHVQCAY
jgi:peptidoglycan hydrolase CwlO-like protein